MKRHDTASICGRILASGMVIVMVSITFAVIISFLVSTCAPASEDEGPALKLEMAKPAPWELMLQGVDPKDPIHDPNTVKITFTDAEGRAWVPMWKRVKP